MFASISLATAAEIGGKSGAIHAVLHHDLGQDMRRACQEVLRAQGALPALTHALPLSAIQIVTSWNLPALNGLN